jgi:hypothetical protein
MPFGKMFCFRKAVKGFGYFIFGYKQQLFPVGNIRFNAAVNRYIFDSSINSSA